MPAPLGGIFGVQPAFYTELFEVAVIMVVLSLVTVVALLAAPKPVEAAEADTMAWGTASD